MSFDIPENRAATQVTLQIEREQRSGPGKPSAIQLPA